MFQVIAHAASWHGAWTFAGCQGADVPGPSIQGVKMTWQRQPAVAALSHSRVLMALALAVLFVH